MTHQNQLIWLKKRKSTRSKQSSIVAKRDAISSTWSNGKATLMQKTPGNHAEMYAMPKKKWKTFTNNILTNRNPLLLIEESSSLPTAQSSTLSNQCSNSPRHHGDHDLKRGVMLRFQHFSTQTSVPFRYHPTLPTPPNNHPILPIYLFLFLHLPIIPIFSYITLYHPISPLHFRP